MSIANVEQKVAGHMESIQKMFKPGAKIMVMVRQPNDPHGRMDFLMGDDDLQEAMNLLARRMAAQPKDR